MTTLTAWAFPGADDAEEAIKRLEALQSQTVITIDDAAVVSWEVGKKKPKTRQLHNTTGEGALSGAFWGMFLGLIFLVPCSAPPSAPRLVPGARRSLTWVSATSSSMR
jgi:uncharacterized membrane protein